MRTTSHNLAEKFHIVVDRMVAAMHQQRAIEARRVLRRYRHLLGAEHEVSPLNEIISIRSEKDIADNAHPSDARERATDYPTLERA